jgi:hypothetical protein
MTSIQKISQRHSSTIRLYRILRLYYYGKIKLAKAISRRIQFELNDWFDEMRWLTLHGFKKEKSEL